MEKKGLSVHAMVQPVLSECTALGVSRNSLKWVWFMGSGTDLGRESESTDYCHAASRKTLLHYHSSV